MTPEDVQYWSQPQFVCWCVSGSPACSSVGV
jgi:hypothetical protein